MVYGWVRDHNRLSDGEYRYRSVSKSVEYVYVDHGYYDIRHWTFYNPRQPLSVPAGIVGHMLYFYYLYQYVTSSRYWTSLIFNVTYGYWCGFGITAGGHRLWAHRTYSAHWSVRLWLAIGFTISAEGTVLDWARGHRVHHKWSDTDSDPHNAKRSFWFAHVGWLFQREHPDVIRAERQIRTFDLESDPVVMWQHKYYLPLLYFWSGLVPIFLHWYWIGDHWYEAAIFGGILRNIQAFHSAAFVNSAAHMFGQRPYNSNIIPSENMAVSLGAMGEGMTTFVPQFSLN